MMPPVIDIWLNRSECIRTRKRLKNMLLTAGFDRCDYQNLSGGIVAIHQGVKY